MARAYYNEIDKQAAQWLRNLIARGLIAPGDVDERSISDVSPDDLRGYTQCHFFAGIGVWSYALRRAGWDDSRPVWTGSCPCQPYSQAGARAGFADPRHLWPDFAWLIRERRPPVVFGEQVASKTVEPWVDLVHANLEAMGYAFGAVPFPSAGVGAPHIRDRLFWVADAGSDGLQGLLSGWADSQRETKHGPAGCGSSAVGMADAPSRRLGEFRGTLGQGHIRYPDCGGNASSGMADANGRDAGAERQQHGGQLGLHSQDGGDPRTTDQGAWFGSARDCSNPGPVNGLWRDADWLSCRDGKWRPVESGTFPLAHGAASRVVRLRAYGNAINGEAATQFIIACLESAHGLGRADLIELDPLI